MMRFGFSEAAVVIAFTSLGLATAASGAIIDTFNRPDNDALGGSEAGGFNYVETLTTGATSYTTPAPGGTVNSAKIQNDQLVITGDTTVAASKPTGRVYLSGYESADTTVSLTGEFKPNKTTVASGDRVKNTLGVMLRSGQGALFGNGAANDADTGYISVEFLSNGQVFVRERGADGKLKTLVSPTYTYTAGSLGTTRNGLPYDVNDDGVLGAGETFDFAVSAIGNALTVSVNGQALATTTTTFSSAAVNGVGLFKGMPSSSFEVASDIYVDDLAIDPVPEPAALALICGAAVLGLRRRKARS